MVQMLLLSGTPQADAADALAAALTYAVCNGGWFQKFSKD